MAVRLAALLPELSNAIRRFPEAALSALVCTCISLPLANAAFGGGLSKAPGWLSETHLAAAYCFPALFAVGLYAERHATSVAKRLLFAVTATAVITALMWFQFAVDLSRPLLLALVLMLPALAAHAYLPKNNESFWLHNHDLWLGLGMAIAGAGLLALSISAILATLDTLFQINAGELGYGYGMAIAANLAGPLIWLTLAPRDDAQASAANPGIDTQQTSSRAIALVAKFILVPVLVIYTAIIYFYAIKIAIDGALPKGQIGWMVLLYGAAGTITLLFVYPTRDTGGALVSLFYRYWFLMALVPVALLFIAVFTRTSQYGVTEKRYLVILAGVWLVAQALLFGWRNEDKRDLRVILASLAALIGVAMAGPWGSAGSTARLLASDFLAAAASSPAFKDGKFDSDRLEPAARTRLVSIIQYLGEYGRLDLLSPAIAAEPSTKHLDITPALDFRERQVQAARFADVMGLPGALISPGPSSSRQYFTFYAAAPLMLDGRHFAGPITVTLAGPDAEETANITAQNAAAILPTAGVANGRINIVLPSHGSVSFDAAAIAKAMSDQARGTTGVPPLRFTAKDGDAPVDLIVFSGTGFKDENSFEPVTLTVWLAWSD